ncbi:MAG: lactonase family protein [Acidobacteria bacterium]|nr:lactonase family protein [Acidobacteriota bacterium]
MIKSVGLAGLALSLPIHKKALSFSTQDLILYVGTYTRGKSEGIYLYRMNLASGELKPLSITKGITNPSYLAIDAQRKYLYSVNEVGEFEGKRTGAVTAFAVDQKTGELRKLNQQASQGAGPCYITIDASGKFVLVANYNSGTLAVLPIKSDGSLGESTDVVQHRGSGANPRRQEGPHAHCIMLDRSGRYAFAADLGIDRVMIYRFDAKTGKLTPNSTPFAQTKPGAGPRHFDIHPGGKFAYVINELDSSLTAFAYDNSKGVLKELQTVSTLPEGFQGNNSCADVHVHPSGKFIYGSNRGHDSIVAFTIDERTGKLSYLADESTQGKTPRNFGIDPTGAFLLAANQNSDTVVTFQIDQKTGKLRPTGKVTEVPTPVCLKFIPAFS